MKKGTTTMQKKKSGSKEEKGGDSPSQLIDASLLTNARHSATLVRHIAIVFCI